MGGLEKIAVFFDGLLSQAKGGIVATAIAVFRAGLERDIVEAFAKKKSPSSQTKWPKRKDNKPHPLLILSGDMFAAAVESARSGGQERADGVTIPLDGPFYRLFHHFGTSKMPMRRFFGLSFATAEIEVPLAIEAAALNNQNLLQKLMAKF